VLDSFEKVISFSPINTERFSSNVFMSRTPESCDPPQRPARSLKLVAAKPPASAAATTLRGPAVDDFCPRVALRDRRFHATVDIRFDRHRNAGTQVHLEVTFVSKALDGAFAPDCHRAMLSDRRYPGFSLVDGKVSQEELWDVVMVARFIRCQFY
jgi:hypothetical protein